MNLAHYLIFARLLAVDALYVRVHSAAYYSHNLITGIVLLNLECVAVIWMSKGNMKCYLQQEACLRKPKPFNAEDCLPYVYPTATKDVPCFCRKPMPSQNVPDTDDKFSKLTLQISLTTCLWKAKSVKSEPWLFCIWCNCV